MLRQLSCFFLLGRNSADHTEWRTAELTEPVNQFYSCMKGTDSKTPHCIALEGKVGHAVSCKIYSQRSTTCHEFNIVDDDGQINPQCTRARAQYGLAPLVLLEDC